MNSASMIPPSTGKVLVLGGTTEGKSMVTQLLAMGVPVVYSIAGLVRMPEFPGTTVPCEIIHGGFKSLGGLSNYLQQQPIVGVCDATHPFAKTMSSTAWKTCSELRIPYWRLQRSEWPEHRDDDWTEFKEWSLLLSALPKDKRVFFSAGQLSDASVQWLLQHPNQDLKHLWRTAVSPARSLSDTSLPDNLTAVEAIGPFDLNSERKLFEMYQIDLLVTKNSGGDATYAKIKVAREKGLPVLMLERPTPVPDKVCYEDLDKLTLLIVSQLKLNKMMVH